MCLSWLIRKTRKLVWLSFTFLPLAILVVDFNSEIGI